MSNDVDSSQLDLSPSTTSPKSTSQLLGAALSMEIDRRLQQIRGKRIVVLCGGDSAERDVSLTTGQAVCSALRASGWQVETYDARRGADLSWLRSADVFYNALHGEFGEDGTVQGVLSFANKAYSGSGIAASALTIDKSRTKYIAQGHGLQIADSIALDAEALAIVARDSRADRPDRDLSDLLTPALAAGIHRLQARASKIVIKPNAEGSSVGLDIVDQTDILSGLRRYVKTYVELLNGTDRLPPVILEQYINGIELSVAVISVGSHVEAVGVAEIELASDTYNYEAKYKSSSNTYHCPARISEETTTQLLEDARAIHLACGCNGISRSDFILPASSSDPVTDGNVRQGYFLETNTSPGMTPSSLYPKIAGARGYSFSDVVHWSLASSLGVDSSVKEER